MDIISIKNFIKDIPDFPKPGIIFKDITPILEHTDILFEVCKKLGNSLNLKRFPRKIVAIESRGFIFGTGISMLFNVPLVLVRKKGKLPGEIERIEYELEYGTDVLEIQKKSIKKYEEVCIIDDLLATGGTILAATELVKKLEGRVCGIGTIIELKDLHTKEKELLKKYFLTSLITY